MKVLFDHSDPFLLAHGGFQIQIERTKTGLESIGIHVEFLRWWDESQSGDLLHYFGRPSAAYVQFAHRKKMKVVVEELLSGLGSRNSWQRAAQKGLMKLAQAALPKGFTARLGWETYWQADAFIANTSWEAGLMVSMFGAAPDKVHCVANGVETVFLEPRQIERGPWLICSGTITERKRVLELAEAAVIAQTPLWVVGKPYGDSDPYALRFLEVSKRNPQWVRYEGSIQDRARLAQAYREARGFVLLSTMETLSLAASEAAACRCPLLLSDLPWARSAFQHQASYCPVPASRANTAAVLRHFYNQAPDLPRPPLPKTWPEIARQIQSIYESLLSNS
jgi:glycosyltransferase involved in cell wall biosynthesis